MTITFIAQRKHVRNPGVSASAHWMKRYLKPVLAGFAKALEVNCGNQFKGHQFTIQTIQMVTEVQSQNRRVHVIGSSNSTMNQLIKGRDKSQSRASEKRVMGCLLIGFQRNGDGLLTLTRQIDRGNDRQQFLVEYAAIRFTFVKFEAFTIYFRTSQVERTGGIKRTYILGYVRSVLNLK